MCEVLQILMPKKLTLKINALEGKNIQNSYFATKRPKFLNALVRFFLCYQFICRFIVSRFYDRKSNYKL
jgi:hypothetical protein